VKLHENIALFKQAVRFTAQQKGILDIYIEKDYWVTLALFTIFKNNIGKETIFKGGTALSKCNHLIDRFSEDIDLVILRKDRETNNQLKTKLKKISKCVESVIPEIHIDEITNKMGMIRKTAHNYDKNFDNDFGQIRDIVIIESSWLGNFEPYSKGIVSSFIYEMMIQTNQLDIIEEYNINPFEVLVLSPKRTLCEKIMSLVRCSYTKEPINDLRLKIRHAYDIHMILKDTEFRGFFNSEKFDYMLLKVANDDALSFKSNNEWLSNHPTKAIIFSDTKNIWNEIKTTYENEFKRLVFGEFPNETEIMNTLITVANRLKEFEWDIQVKIVKQQNEL